MLVVQYIFIVEMCNHNTCLDKITHTLKQGLIKGLLAIIVPERRP